MQTAVSVSVNLYLKLITLLYYAYQRQRKSRANTSNLCVTIRTIIQTTDSPIQHLHHFTFISNVQLYQKH